MPFVIYGSFFSKSLFIPPTSLDIVKYFTERAGSRSFNIIYLPISKTILKSILPADKAIANGARYKADTKKKKKKNRQRNVSMKKDRVRRARARTSTTRLLVGGEKERDSLGVFSSFRNGASSVRREVHILSGEPRAVISSIPARAR